MFDTRPVCSVPSLCVKCTPYVLHPRPVCSVPALCVKYPPSVFSTRPVCLSTHPVCYIHALCVEYPPRVLKSKPDQRPTQTATCVNIAPSQLWNVGTILPSAQVDLLNNNNPLSVRRCFRYGAFSARIRVQTDLGCTVASETAVHAVIG